MGGGKTTSNQSSNPTVNFAPTSTGGGSISIGGNVGTGNVDIGGNASSTGASTTADVGVKVTPVMMNMIL